MSFDLRNSDSSIEVLYDNNEDVDSSKEKLLDNKGMVTPLPSASVSPQPNIRINVTDPDKNNTTSSRPVKICFRRKIRLHYAINATLTVLVTSVIILLELGYIPATKTGFYCKDPSLSYRFRGDTITATTLLVSNLLVIPLVVLCLTELLCKTNPLRICLAELWYFYKEFFTGSALVLMITEIAKALIGEHRPHFFDVCRPDTAENCTSGEYIETYDCTLTKYSRYFMSDTSRSFPSGHSSLSTFVALFCSYLIQKRLRAFHSGQLLKPFFICICITWCLVCSLTRITDKRHHWWDVGTGVVLGALGALYSVTIIHRRTLKDSIPRVAMSTTTLLDIKNKDAKSEII